MKKNKSKYEKTIRKAMIEQDVDRNELSDYIEYNGASNLMAVIKIGSLGNRFHVKLCKKLKLDVGDLLKLKLESRYEGSK